MSRENIKQHLRNKLNDWIESMSMGDKALTEVIRNSCFIAGGAIASLVRGEPVNDYDIYFIDVTNCQWAVDVMVSRWNASPEYDGRRIEHYKVVPLGEELDRDNLRGIGPIAKRPITPDTPKYAPVCFTPNAITLNNQIQLITRFIGEPDEIVKRFDFAHTQCYYYAKEDALVMPPQALESLAIHELIYTGSDYPLSSIIRTKKYIQRGWSVNAGQYLKMAIQLHALDFTQVAVLADQLVGVDLAYFSDLLATIHRMGETKEGAKESDFSLIFEGVDKAPTNFYDPFYADDKQSLGSYLLDIVSRLWD